MAVVPDREHATVAEVDNDLLHITDNSDPRLRDLAARQVPLYSPIHLTHVDPTTTTHFTDEIEAVWNAFVQHLPSIFQEWWQVAKTELEQRWANTPLSSVSNTAFRYVDNYFLTHKPLPEADHSFHVGKRSNLAWHPHRPMLAVVLENDAVYIYEKEDDGTWTCRVLKHHLMKDITAVEWKHRTSGTLAVACRKGVCVWSISYEDRYQRGTVEEPTLCKSAAMQYFTNPGHDHIISIAWDPSPGSHLLATASSVSGSLVIYDTMLLQTIQIKRTGSANRLLRWSPNGEWLYVAGHTGYSRMWNTKSWTHKDLSNPPGLWVESACWAPNSRNLFIAMHGKTDLHAFYWTDGKADAEIRYKKVYAMAPPPAGATRTGSIRQISLDPVRGERLAVAFDHSEHIELYAVDETAALQLGKGDLLKRIGYIRGSVSPVGHDLATPVNTNMGTKHIHISFSPSYHKSVNSILAILYENGIISFVSHA